jgi:Uma2 family endonuclease
MHSPDPRLELGEFASFQWTRTELCRQLRSFFSALRSAPIRVGTDVPFYYDPGDRLARITPDLYVVEGMGYEEQLRSYRIWERGGVAPALVVHLVDTSVSPEDGLTMHFLRLGTEDVVLYDPLWYMQVPAAPSGRRLLWHYRRSGERLRLMPQEHPARVCLDRYGFWLIHRGGADLRVYQGRAAQVPGEADLWSP